MVDSDGGGMDVAAWRDAFAGTLGAYYTAAQLVGQGGGTLTRAPKRC